MTNEELKSCIGTIEMLRRLAYNIHGVMDVIDADNCEKIIKVLSDIPKYKDAYNKGWDDGAKATNIDCGVVWEERIDAIKTEIKDLHNSHMIGFVSADGAVDTCLKIIERHCGGDNE